MGIRIKGTGMFVPEKILTNADLEKMVETSDEWITTRTGIKERHIADKQTATSDLAYAAAVKALEMAGVSPSELDLITVASVTPDKLFPNTAALVQRKLGACTCPCFDLEAACSGLIYSIEVAHSLMAANKKYKKALVIGAEKLSSIVDWTDRSTCVLFGDGAAALVLESGDEIEGDFYVAGKLAADGWSGNLQAGCDRYEHRLQRGPCRLRNRSGTDRMGDSASGKPQNHFRCGGASHDSR